MKAIGEKRSRAVLLVMIAGYAALFAYASIFRYRQFLFQNFDLAIGNQILWNLLHGSMECTIRGGNFFGDHFRPIFFLYLPLYAVWPDPRTLLFLQSVILGCGAIPLYGIARDKLGVRFGLVFAAAYLFNPLVGYINLFEFHPEVAVAPLLLGAIYYFYRDRLRPFALCILLSLMCKENISLIVFTFGFWALWHRKRWPWYIATFGAGAAWAVLGFLIVIPYFNAGVYPYVQLYGYLGSSAGAIIRTCVTQPLYILSIVCVYPNLKYMFDVLVQFGFLPLLAPLTLLPAVPPLLQILLSHARGVPEIYTHYGAKLIPFLFAGSVAVVSWWCRLLKRRPVRVFFGVYLVVFAIAASVRYGPHIYLPQKWADTAQPETAAMKRSLVEKVPPDAAAVATFDFLPALSGRRELYSFHYLYWGYDQLTGKAFTLPDQVGAALLDFNDFNIFWAVYSPRGDENMRAFLAGGKWRVVAGADSSFLFEKDPPKGDDLYAVLSEPVVGHPLIVQLNDRIVFLGYDMDAPKAPRGGVLTFFTYFRQTNPFAFGQRVVITKNYGVYYQLCDAGGRVVREVKWPVCYGVYPNMKWKDGEVVRMLQKLYIPRGLTPGAYTLRMGTYESKIDSFRLDRKRDESEIILKHPPVDLARIEVSP